jgi:hypothetical protein
MSSPRGRLQDAGDHRLVVPAPRPTMVPRQVRLDRHPRNVRQSELGHARTPVIHARTESGKLLRLSPLIGFRS